MHAIFSFLLFFQCFQPLEGGKEASVLTIRNLPYYSDFSRQLTLQDVLLKKDSLMVLNPDFVPADYNPRAAYWIELDFCLEEGESNHVMEFYDQSIDTIKVYLKHESDSGFRTYEFGDQYPFGARDLNHKNFQVILDKSGQYLAYVRVTNREYADIRIALKTVGEFIGYALFEYYLYGIFYGMIAIISLYNILLFTAIREQKYLYYTFYILSVGFFALSVDGIAYQMLWPSSPGWNTVAHGVFLYSIIVWSVVFSRKFLNIRGRAPFYDKLLVWIMIVRTLFFVYALIFDNSLFSFRLIEVIPLSVIFISSILVYRRGYKPARFFIVAYGVLFLGFIVKALLMYFFIPILLGDFNSTVQILSYYSLHISFLFEMLFLSVALSDRIRIIKENRDRAMKRIVAQQEEYRRNMDHVNARLEQKIQNRTEELRRKNELLEELNGQLFKQKTEISEINSMLDLDNWKLRNNLKSAQKSRILNKDLAWTDFEQLFPDDITCLQFLSGIKWKSGYECRRCSNEKYIDGDHLSRRCTKCGYNETPTAYTIFHAIKFPLNKALYILYLGIMGDNRSLNTLSAEMDLRRNTIWSMKKKIAEYAAEHPDADLNIFKELDFQIK